ncbi:hypothetical protein E2C01_023839 [Portunus trituberculatus]|uniref:Uncharacterized protein n=1 Tax=Portunus trituberculatus TaxID=210409 RepID=A0A5B7E981_PORTR|nr:hypothetical protein [Portunus trituberculatus]
MHQELGKPAGDTPTLHCMPTLQSLELPRHYGANCLQVLLVFLASHQETHRDGLPVQISRSHRSLRPPLANVTAHTSRILSFIQPQACFQSPKAHWHTSFQ